MPGLVFVSNLGRLCGSEHPGEINSLSNQVVVRFHTDSSVGASGFILQYKAVFTPPPPPPLYCSGTYELDSNYGYIRATFNDTYNNNMDCEWRVTTPVQYPIHFYFESFDLEHSADCGFDYLELEDLSMPGHNLTGGRLCGSEIPGDIYSRSNQVVVRFHSDSSVVGRGFVLRFETTFIPPPPPPLYCNGTYELDSGSGVIRPTYTDTYDNDMDCEWRVTTSENSVLYFHFESFDLEGSTGCPFDYLELEDLSRPGLFLRGGRLCGSEVPGPFYSASNRVVVRFRSDSSVVGHGFVLHFDSLFVDTMSSTMSTTPRLTSPDFYTTKHSLPPTTSTTTYGYRSTGDSTETTESTPPSDSTPPGDSTPLAETSPTSSTSTPSVTRTTYWPDWISTRFSTSMWMDTTTPTALCPAHSVLTAPSGTVGASWASSYPSGLSCAWEVVAPEDSTLLLAFLAFDVESCGSCGCDYVELLDAAAPGRPLGGSRLCGSSLPAPVTSLSNRVLIRFVTDPSVGGKGFELHYEVVSTGTSSSGIETETTSTEPSTTMWIDTTTSFP
nr:tolloid-like protein 1 [Penaeus vannamei]